MATQPRTITHIFNLDAADGYERAESFKALLENDGWAVTAQPFGFNSVKITGVRR